WYSNVEGHSWRCDRVGVARLRQRDRERRGERRGAGVAQDAPRCSILQCIPALHTISFRALGAGYGVPLCPRFTDRARPPLNWAVGPGVRTDNVARLSTTTDEWIEGFRLDLAAAGRETFVARFRISSRERASSGVYDQPRR